MWYLDSLITIVLSVVSNPLAKSFKVIEPVTPPDDVVMSAVPIGTVPSATSENDAVLAGVPVRVEFL